MTTPASSSSTSSSTSSGPAAVPRAPAARSSGADPSAVTDGNGNASIHAPLDVGDAVNPDRSQPGEGRDEFEVHILHDPANRLEMSGCPDEAALFERRPSTGQSADPAWSFVNRQQGTLERPFRIVYPVEDALYIGGAPQADDIQQGGLADCYFLASVASIAARDPGQIQSMISLRGGQASVRLHRFDSTANAWVPCTIGVTNELAQYSDGAGNPQGLVGARFRIGEQAQHSAWSAMVNGTTLSVNEDAYVEVAAWAPILEKAFAAYAQTWGQYGGFQPTEANAATDAAGNTRSGYEVINGGVSDYSYPIIYGGDVVASGDTAINYTPGADLVMANLPAIQNLLRVNGEGVPDGQQFHMTSMISRVTAIDRLDAQCGDFLNRYAARYPGFASHLRNLRDQITRFRNAGPANKDAALARVGQLAAAIARPGAFPALDSDREGGDFRDLQELMLVTANILTDAGGGQRFIYAWHSYTVLGSQFVDQDGAAMNLTLGNLATQAPRIDPTRSSVQLRNPHGGNEPDRRGTGPADGQNDGRFSLSLESWFRVFGLQQHGLVRT